jgi:hypothetical protein
MPQIRCKELRDYEWLYNQYVQQEKSQIMIANMLSVSGTQVYRAMKDLGIPVRSLSDAGKIRCKDVISYIPKLNDSKWLEEQYIKYKKTPEQLALELDCTFETILIALKKHGIPIRSRSVKGNILRSDAIKELRDFDWLYDQYITKHLSISKIADSLKCSGHTVITYLKRWRIRRRKILYVDKEQRKKTKDQGYIVVFRPEHPNATSSGWILEHRLIVSDILDRELTKSEVVHHLNLKPDDNREDNFLVFSSNKLHMEFHENPPDWMPRCECCGHPQPEKLERRPDDVPLYYG